MQNKRFVFILILLFILFTPVFCTTLYYLTQSGSEWTEVVLKFISNSIVNTAPYIIKDIGLFTEATPAVLAAALMITAPNPYQTKTIVLGVLLSFSAYLVYLYMGSIFSANIGADENENSTIIRSFSVMSDWNATDISEKKDILNNSFSALRTLCLIITASLLGISLRKKQTGSNDD